jgi:hypothetical protein
MKCASFSSTAAADPASNNVVESAAATPVPIMVFDSLNMIDLPCFAEPPVRGKHAHRGAGILRFCFRAAGRNPRALAKP